MRSRYSAFVTYNVDYLEETMLAPALTLFNKLETLNWTMSVRWKGLNVLSSTATHDTGYVSFIAYYEENNGTHHISEASTFKKKNGKWFYVSGISLDG